MSDLENYGELVEVYGKQWRLIEIIKMDLDGNWLCLATQEGDIFPKSVYTIIVPNMRGDE